MKLGILAVFLAEATVSAAQAFIIFTADAAFKDASVPPVMAEHLSATDYLGLRSANRVASLKNLVQADHRVEVDASLEALGEGLRNSELNSGQNSVFYCQIGIEDSRP